MSIEAVKEFLILPLILPPLSSHSASAKHYIYLKPHAPKLPTPLAPRTLFLANVPFDSTPANLTALLRQLQPELEVEDVLFEGSRSVSKPAVAPHTHSNNRKRKRKQQAANLDEIELPQVWDRELRAPGSTALVILKEERAVRGVMKAVKGMDRREDRLPVWGEGVEDEEEEPLGLHRYTTHSTLTYPSRRSLIESVDAYMTAFSARESALAAAAKKARSEPDADGFITVTRAGGAGVQGGSRMRTAPARKQDAEAAKVRQDARKEDLTDFYRWQVREQRKEKEKELRRGFEEDKRRIEEVKARKGGKGFVPEE